MHTASAGVIGIMGILLSGMGNPAKVLNFFDVAGTWDPSLAFVMVGAVAVASVGYRIMFRRKSPILADGFNLPTSTVIDRRLLGGAAVFGIGWGFSGFCPGGAIPMLASGHVGPIVFLIGLIGGLAGARHLQVRQAMRSDRVPVHRA
jgi:uncharacterized protein